MRDAGYVDRADKTVVRSQRRSHHRYLRRRQHRGRDPSLHQPHLTSNNSFQITREVGEDNIFLFGNLSEDVEDLRHAHYYSKFTLDPMLQRVFDTIKSGTFGDANQFSALVNSIVEHGDYYLVSDDFKSYIYTQNLIDDEYRNQESWLTKTITAVSRMGFFSSDRCIEEYATEVRYPSAALMV